MELLEVAGSEAVQSQVSCSPSSWADYTALLASLLSSLLQCPSPAVCGQLWYLCVGLNIWRVRQADPCPLAAVQASCISL